MERDEEIGVSYQLAYAGFVVAMRGVDLEFGLPSNFEERVGKWTDRMGREDKGRACILAGYWGNCWLEELRGREPRIANGYQRAKAIMFDVMHEQLLDEGWLGDIGDVFIARMEVAESYVASEEPDATRNWLRLQQNRDFYVAMKMREFLEENGAKL